MEWHPGTFFALPALDGTAKGLECRHVDTLTHPFELGQQNTIISVLNSYLLNYQCLAKKKKKEKEINGGGIVGDVPCHPFHSMRLECVQEGKMQICCVLC